jgi:hypothetical protein
MCCGHESMSDMQIRRVLVEHRLRGHLRALDALVKHGGDPKDISYLSKEVNGALEMLQQIAGIPHHRSKL